jgi:hypothetical protein
MMGSRITLGTCTNGTPLFVSRDLFGHMHVQGMTGSGKTSLALLPLIKQFLEPYEENGVVQRDAIVIFDLGGDSNLFFNVRDMVSSSPAKPSFRFLCLDPSVDCHAFPPFQAVPPQEQNALRLASMLVQAFQMDFGIVYGGTYFTQQNLAALLRVARTLKSQNASLRDVADYLDDPANRRLFRDADQVRLTFDFLLDLPQLTEVGNPDREIRFDRAIENAEVVYFFCPTLEEPTTARLVAGLGLYTLISVAMQRKKKGEPLRKVRVFVDEFSEIVSRSVGALLAQSRKFGISMFLANQSTSQLKNRDLSLADVVFEGTVVKQYFTCLEDDIRRLQSISKEAPMKLGSTSAAPFGMAVSSSTREVMAPILERNKILDVTYSLGKSFVCINDGSGHREPVEVKQSHQFEDKSGIAFEALTTSREFGTFAAGLSPADREAREAPIRALIDKKKAEELPESL